MKDRGIVIVTIVLVLSLAINGYLFMALQRSPEVVYLDAPKQETPATTQELSPVVVHISGAVVNPSVYSLPAGSRVLSVVESAGGALAGADLERINLARVLVDGEQVHIYTQGDASSPVLIAGNSDTSSTGVNINMATQAQLETLPGIGPAKALDIITYRTQNGSFKKIEDIMSVKGIAEKTFESIKSLIRIN